MLKTFLVLSSLTTTLFALSFAIDTFTRGEAISTQAPSSNKIENYDIRSDRSPDAVERLRVYRGAAPTDLPNPA